MTPSDKINELINFDKSFNAKILIGTDEAGRGPLAGPVVAAAVCFKSEEKEISSLLTKLNDSKKLTYLQREELYEEIKKLSYYSIKIGSIAEIEKYNILNTSLMTMKKAVQEVAQEMKIKEDFLLLVDGNFTIPKYKITQKAIVKGDGKSASIAAASILAKVYRDKLMEELHKEFPEYNWAKNKGYGTKEHLSALDSYGVTKYHRQKFLRKYFEKAEQQKLF